MAKYIISIIFSCMAIMLTTSCEQTELRKSDNIPGPVVETRSIEDCEECPLEDCCCTVVAITALGTFDVDLVFCGTTSPGTTIPCSVMDIGTCSDITLGLSEPISLDQDQRRAQFCAALNQTFGITTLPYVPNVTISITCQDDIFPPQTVYIDLGATTNKPYWVIQEDCELFSCF